jgi:hypothetical protein
MARGDFNASRTGQNQRGDSLTDRRVETAIVMVLTSKFGLSARNIQQIQELSGLRGSQKDGSRPREAVRRQDISAIGRMGEMKSLQVSGTPTADDYNALQNDVRIIYEALTAIALAGSN